MLLHLSITNYALIEKLEIDFSKGFVVITGETGAGKSILLGALSLILGQRVDSSVLNSQDEKCIVEGVFKINKEQFFDFFKANDIDFEEETTIRRELTFSGKSRAFINDTPVNLILVKDLVEQLINIHSQHQNLLVKEGDFQLAVVDTFSKNLAQVEQYKIAYKKYISKRNELIQLKNSERSSKNELEFLNFQITEIEQLKLQDGEQLSLEEQLNKLSHVEEIKSVLFTASNSLSEGDSNLIGDIKKISQLFSKIASLSPEYQLLKDRIDSTLIDFTDLSREVSLLSENTNFDNELSEYISNRLSLIYTLEKKHQLSNSDELIALHKELTDKIYQITSIDDEILAFEKEVTLLESEAKKIALAISTSRKKSFSKLSDNIKNTLKELGMPEANFLIQHEIEDELGVNGFDKIEFLFTANKGFNPISIYKSASGGEISRVMLTIKSILAESNNLSTIIFDEIDTGVSGDIADKMGEIMKQMSKSIQVIAITHLPQVAAKSNQHFKIFKQVKNNKSITVLSELSQKEKIEEIAKMLSGKELTQAAIENAKNLISN